MKRANKKKKGSKIKHMNGCSLILAAIITCALLFCSNDRVMSQEKDQPKSPETSVKQSPDPQRQESIKGYPVRERRIGGPNDVEWDLDNSFPKSDSVLELILRCNESEQQ